MANREQIKALERKAIIRLVAVVVFIVGLLFTSYLFRGPALDEQTHCPKQTEVFKTRGTILLVDLTDALPAMAASNVLTMAKELALTSNKFEPFSVFILDADTSRDIQPVFSQCSPGQPGLTDYFSKGRRELRGQFESTFVSALEAPLKEQLKHRRTTRRSPIIETVRSIAHSQFWSKSNRLYIFSDFIENSSIVSLYKEHKPFDAIVRSPAGAVINGIDLGDTSVSLCPTEYPVEQLSPTLQESAIRFWKNFFQYTHASRLRVSCRADDSTVR